MIPVARNRNDPNMVVMVRPALEHDAAAIGELAQEFAAYLRALGDPTDFRFDADACLRDGFGDVPAFHGLVADSDEVVVGYLLYHFGYEADRAKRVVHIVDLYVAPKSRRQGAGRALFETVTDIARRGGAGELVWAIYRPNALAYQFYESLGAKRIDDLDWMRLRI